MPCLGELLSIVLSRLQGWAEVASSQTIIYPVVMSREMHEGKQLEQLGTRWKGGHNKKRLFVSFCRQTKGQRQVSHNILANTSVQCSGLWDVASLRNSPPNAAQKAWHNHTVQLKHCSRLCRLKLKNARCRKTLLQRQSQSNPGRFVD